MTKLITYRQLRRLGACSNQLDIFKTKFGFEVEITLELVIENVYIFNFYWVVKNLLTAPALAEYEQILVTTFFNLHTGQTND